MSDRKRPARRSFPRFTLAHASRRARLLGGAAFVMALAAPTVPLPAMAQGAFPSDVRPDQIGRGSVPGMGAGMAKGGAERPGSPSAGPLGGLGGGTEADRNAPVTFTADAVEYDQNENRVTASGSVEAWQNERILRADRFTYDRDTGVAIAEGNVQLLEPDGQVLFADRVELMGGMRDAVVSGMRGLLAQNGRLAANGARRRTTESGAVVSDLARVVYSSCDLCVEDPTEPPLWQLRSRLATQDGEARRIRFRDATLQFGGIPTFYTPYLSMPDPSTPRSSGFLTPSFGQTNYLGAFAEIPYYWAINEQSDLTVTPLLSTEAPPGGFFNYRQRFNFGQMQIEGSLGQLTGRESSEEEGLGAHIFARGLFTIDENWEAGFSINRATSETYLRAYRQPATSVLSSSVFAQGFWGYDSYARVNALAFQSLREQDVTSRIPFVLPNIYYETVLGRDSLGGTLTADATAFNVYRSEGTKTQRAGTRWRYELPRFDSVGAQWTFRVQADALAYNANDLNLAPNFSGIGSTTTATGNIRAAVDWRLPLVRSAGTLGQQLIEPRVQLVTGPNIGRQRDIPNEDSLDFEFTDANLFALNRFNGRDRQEGGTRVDAALRAAWYFPNGGVVEGLVGRSFRASDEKIFPEHSGLDKRASDWVGRVMVAPTSWFDVTARTRLDGDSLDRRLIDTTAGFGLDPLGLQGTRINFGYLYQMPSTLRTPPRYTREVYGGVSTRLGTYWRGSVFGRYDLEDKRGVSVGASATYEDECLIFESSFYRSYAEDPSTNEYYPGGTTLIFRVGLKTVGDFALRAL
ncbi:LPS-assembly protein LptD [Roseomonas xinghualingensis]|uniref:LPS-assembly protein LptD n=1 Tax=Roseomonas xinghualingensis TaxID=2986475 RepID=UPI0021F1E539|nr:LPS assembly protein LptD [Roseomonas sp. SXEYE001]MCV4208276.1 LPS assembly protein LptD [Roseomonas sp. SXEYE001]